MPIHIHCPFLIELFSYCCFKSSTYTLIRKSLFDMCFASLFSWSVLVFSLSNYVFTENFLILMKSNVLKFSSYITLLILHLKIHQLAWAHLGFCLCFFTYFIVLNFACRSMIYFDLVFLKSVMTMLGFIFWIRTSNCFSTICGERLSFLHSVMLVPLSKIAWLCYVGLFLRSLFCYINLFIFPHQYHILPIIVAL